MMLGTCKPPDCDVKRLGQNAVDAIRELHDQAWASTRLVTALLLMGVDWHSALIFALQRVGKDVCCFRPATLKFGSKPRRSDHGRGGCRQARIACNSSDRLVWRG
jgi:hypothetical protein